MQKPENPTKQFYKLLYSHHRKVITDIGDGFNNNQMEFVWMAKAADQRHLDIKRTLYVGFGLVAASILAVGVANYKDAKDLDKWVYGAGVNNPAISPDEKTFYSVDNWKRGDCSRYEVWQMGVEHGVVGAPPTSARPVATFTLPGMPDCKP